MSYERDMTGPEGPCEARSCRETGKSGFCPYAEEINGEKEPAVLCEKHWNERCDDI